MADGRGGSRQGVPGKPYNNRADLNQKPRIPQTMSATGQYGEAAQLNRATQAVPLQPPPGPPQQQPQMAPRTRPMPTPIDAPSARPNEPVTAGAPVGMGPGPEALNLPDQRAQTLTQLLASLDPDSTVASLLAYAQSGRT